MKRLALLSIPDPRWTNPADPNYEPNRVDYRLLIEQAIRTPQNRQMGATIDEMRKGIRVLDALDRTGVGGVLELEDADWDHLCQKLDSMPWAVVDRRFLQFYDDVKEATDAVRDPTHANGSAA